MTKIVLKDAQKRLRSTTTSDSKGVLLPTGSSYFQYDTAALQFTRQSTL
jgi:hypothetical protein